MTQRSLHQRWIIGFPATAIVVSTLALALSGWAGEASAGGATAATNCKGRMIGTADGCRKPKAATRKLTGIIRQSRQTNRLQAVIARVDIKGKSILRRGFGHSQVGVPATPAMNFRIGSMTIPALTTAVYRLHERGRLSLKDPISEWLPGIPRASEVTIRMLMNNTSGYLDWVQGNDAFLDAVHANPFRKWSERELLSTALGRGFACDPGACFNYAHTNFLLLARILRRAAAGTVVSNLQRSVLRPAGMNIAFTRLAPIPAPALSAHTSERGVFEESTNWSPSWGLGNGMLANASIDDVAKEARGILSGRSLSKNSRRDLFRRYGPFLGPPSNRVYFAQGLIMADGWRRQNPYFNGYMGNVAWFPKRRIGVSLVGTRGYRTPVADDRNFTDDILNDIAAYLTPGDSPAL